MNRNLLKTLMIASALFMGTASYAAVEYVVTTENSDDATKQDVTYYFDGTKDFPSDFTVGQTESAYVFKGSDAEETYTLYACTTEGLERLAFNNASDKAVDSAPGAGYWWIRTSNANNKGIQLRGGSSNNGLGTNTGGFAILDLKAGDKVVITGGTFYFSGLSDYDGMLYTFPGASSVNGTEQTPKKKEGEATYTVTGATSSNPSAITIEVTADGYVASYARSYNYKQIAKIVITETKPSVATPDGEIIAVSGTSRTVKLTCTTDDVTIHYTTDGTDPSTSSTEYTDEGITITETTTIKAIAVDDSNNESDVYSKSFEAGTEVSLADITYSITAMTESDGVYYPTYGSFACDNSDVLCTPTATISITEDESEYNEETIDASTGKTYVITASAEGYASSTLTIESSAYTLCAQPSTNFNEISATTLTDVLGDGWTTSSSTTRWGNWNKSGGVNTDLTANSGETYYYATYGTGNVTHALDAIVSHHDAGNSTLLYGYGIGSNNRSTTLSAPQATENSIIEYCYQVYWNGGSLSKYSAYVDYATSTSLTYALPQCYTFYTYNYYVPAKEVTKTIGSTGYASFSSEYNVEVPDGIDVYIATNVGEETVTLETIEADIIPANTGVILSGTASAEYTFQVTYEESEADFSSNILLASSQYPTVGTDDKGYSTYYGLYADATELEFAKITSGIEVDGDKAYLGVSDTSSEAKSLKVVFGTTTGISEISSSKAQEAGAFYNLQGVKVQSPHKGLYIQDGKKVILK